MEHPDAPLSTSMLAERVDMSEHTLTRRFRDETGMTPMEFVVSVRVGHARALLEQTDWPIDRIAAKSGFGPSDALQRAFARRLIVAA
ncbi:MAG TPA: helix-turn-helix domain-containing protein [Steroidobacter sp.]